MRSRLLDIITATTVVLMPSPQLSWPMWHSRGSAALFLPPPARGDAEQRRQPALRSARPFDSMRDEPSSSGRSAAWPPPARSLRRWMDSQRSRSQRCCICALVAFFFFVSNLTPESLYSIYRHRSQQTEVPSMLLKSQVSRIPSCIDAFGARSRTSA